MLFAFMPVLFGMSARAAIPGIADPNLVLPTLFLQLLPAWLGALALAAVFSTAVDTCDGILFMLSTSLSQDIYRRHLNPGATDAQLLRVARTIAAIGGMAGVILSIYLSDRHRRAPRFLFSARREPVRAGAGRSPVSRRAGTPEALAAIAAGIVTLAAIGLAAPPSPWLDPTLIGLIASAVAYVGVMGVRLRFGPARANVRVE